MSLRSICTIKRSNGHKVSVRLVSQLRHGRLITESSNFVKCFPGDRTHGLAREDKRQLTRHNKQATDDKRQFVIPN